MKQNIRAHVQSLFRGAALTMQNAELKEEILQNTLEHYEDLLAEGKSEQEACELAIAGIGDVSQLIEREDAEEAESGGADAIDVMLKNAPAAPDAPRMRELGADDAALTGSAVTIRKGEKTVTVPADGKAAPQTGKAGHAHKDHTGSIHAAMWCLLTALYVVVSFATGAWYLTWVLFIIGASLTCMISAWSAAQKKGFQASRGGVQGAMWTLMTAAYFIISFMTGAWYLTWIVFLIATAFTFVINAAYDMQREEDE